MTVPGVTFLAQCLLALLYALLAHAASAWSSDRLAAWALADLVVLVLVAPLLQARPWAWLLAALSLAGVWWLHGAGLVAVPMLLVPVGFIAVIAWWFARSLQPGRTALITRIVVALEDTTPAGLEPGLLAYTRKLTAAWAWLLGALAVANLLLALIAVPDGLLVRLGIASPVTVTTLQWSWFANIFNYGIVGGFFVIEYNTRKRRFPGRYRNFADFARRLAALGPGFWRDFLK